jgi:hypothetical protein
MGILDDAIREHLELKRRHGMAEDELQRQEEEALGPARRDVAHQHEETELAPGEPADAEPVEESEEELPAASSEDTVLFDSEAAAAEPAPAEPAPSDAHEPTPVEPTPVEPPPVEPPPEDDDEEAEPYDHDPDDEEIVAAEDEDEEDELDVLEDTPDFLQETPEHDRLWFEQKPPRDFDFD